MDEVSVVVPFYNGNQFLAEALESIQSNKLIREIIVVVDTGSIPPKIDNKFVNVKVINNSDCNERGAGVCRSIGFQAAEARFVAFLDCDDIWHKDKVVTQVNLMKKNNAGFSFLTYTHFDENAKIYEPVLPNAEFTLSNFYKKKFTIGCLTVMIDKFKIPDLPKVYIKRRNDYVMWDFAIKYCVTQKICWEGYQTKPLAFHRIHSSSLTSSRFVSALYYFKFLRNCTKSIILSIFYFIHYFLNTVGTR